MRKRQAQRSVIAEISVVERAAGGSAGDAAPVVDAPRHIDRAAAGKSVRRRLEIQYSRAGDGAVESKGESVGLIVDVDRRTAPDGQRSAGGDREIGVDVDSTSGNGAVDDGERSPVESRSPAETHSGAADFKCCAVDDINGGIESEIAAPGDVQSAGHNSDGGGSGNTALDADRQTAVHGGGDVAQRRSTSGDIVTGDRDRVRIGGCRRVHAIRFVAATVNGDIRPPLIYPIASDQLPGPAVKEVPCRVIAARRFGPF